MPNRVDLLSGTEGVTEFADVLGQFQYRVACRLEARWLVLRQLESSRRVRVELDLILDRSDRRDVRRIDWIHQHPHGNQHPRRIELSERQVVLTGIMKKTVDVVVLVDHHHREVAIAAVRYRQPRPCRDIRDRKAVQRVAVHPDHRLPLDRGRLAVVPEDVHAAGIRLQRSEHPIRLGAHEVVDAHLYRHSALPTIETLAAPEEARAWAARASLTLERGYQPRVSSSSSGR